MKIFVGITGSIAAYRSVDFVKKLVSLGHEVQCVLTRGGREFVTAKALETFSGHPVLSEDVFDSSHFGPDHIALARWADLMVIYGATAGFIGRYASGLADDLLNLQLLAFTGPVVIAPAMNPAMWGHPAVQANMQTIRSRHVIVAGPIMGKVACGETGYGHIASDEEIMSQFPNMTPETSKGLLGLRGKRVLISAGPMRTELDPVRFIQNKSSGKMGLALANACLEQGATHVSVLLGPVSSDMRGAFRGVEIIDYHGPEDYESSLDRLFPGSDIFFSAAAVLDFQGIPPKNKIERSQISEMKSLSVEIKPVPDIVAKFGKIKKSHQKVIAFAAESGTEEEILVRAELKMKKKNADAMIANPVWPGLGPEAEENQIWLIRPGKPVEKFGPARKNLLSLPILKSLFESEGSI